MTKGIVDRIRQGAVAGFFAFAAMLAMPASAQQDFAENWDLYFQDPASPIMEQVADFNYWIQILIVLIVIFVMALLAWVMIRYNAKRNPIPSRTSHNTVIEVIWTTFPVIILVAIAIPSFSLLFAQYDPARAIEDYDPAEAITVKAIGEQWFWIYEYPDHGNLQIYSNPVRDAEGNPAGNPRLLETTAPMVVPVDTVIHLQATANPLGVIHAFALPPMAMKLDAVPGRINEMWFRADRTGIFYGQCSELCGVNHAFMPIEVRVVTAEQFEEWVAVARDTGAANELLDGWEAERLAALASAE